MAGHHQPQGQALLQDSVLCRAWVPSLGQEVFVLLDVCPEVSSAPSCLEAFGTREGLITRANSGNFCNNSANLGSAQGLCLRTCRLHPDRHKGPHFTIHNWKLTAALMNSRTGQSSVVPVPGGVILQVLSLIKAT